MGRSSHLTWQRPAPGRRAGWLEYPGGPVTTVAAEAPAMAWSGDRPEGSRCERSDIRATGRQREAKASHRDTKSPHAGAARQPTGPGRVPGSPTGFPGRLEPRSPGPGGTGPGLPTRHPRTRRTSGIARRGRTARAGCEQRGAGHRPSLRWRQGKSRERARDHAEQALQGRARAFPQDRHRLHRARDRAQLRALGEGRPGQPRGLAQGRRGRPADDRYRRRNTAAAAPISCPAPS